MWWHGDQRLGFGPEISVWVWGGDRRWAWDVEIAVEHGFPTFRSDLGGDGGMGLGDGGDSQIWI